MHAVNTALIWLSPSNLHDQRAADWVAGLRAGMKRSA
mgnify:CR=1 FL=1|jgi:hypothetical protein